MKRPSSQRVSPSANSVSPSRADQTTWCAQPSMSPASMKARSSALPPISCVALRSSPLAHSIANSTSSETSSSDEYGSGPSRASK